MIALRNTLVVLLTSVLLTSCFDYEDVEFKGMEGFKIEDRTADNIKVRLDLRVENPNTYNIKIKKSTLDVYINGKYLGEAKMMNDIKLKKKTEDVYPIYMKTDGRKVLQTALGSLGSIFGGGNITVRIKGDIKAKVYGIGKTFPIDVEEPVSMKMF